MTHFTSTNRPTRTLHHVLRTLSQWPTPVGAGDLVDLLGQFHITAHDIDQLARFDEGRYRREKLISNDLMQVLVIGWRPGQFSPIHDHTGSVCAFRVLQGLGVEEQFQLDPDFGIPDLIGKTALEKDRVYSSRDDDIHRVGNASTRENLVTLHVYSPPPKMKTYTLPLDFVI